MTKAYRLRPSELMGVEDSYTAYCFDEACFYFEVCLASGKTAEKLRYMNQRRIVFQSFTIDC